jgi:hypothetical protein
MAQFKFEMPVGWLGDGKLVVETNDFDVIGILKDFVEFQESQGWVECFDFSTAEYDDEDDGENDSSEETTVA